MIARVRWVAPLLIAFACAGSSSSPASPAAAIEDGTPRDPLADAPDAGRRRCAAGPAERHYEAMILRWPKRPEAYFRLGALLQDLVESCESPFVDPLAAIARSGWLLRRFVLLGEGRPELAGALEETTRRCPGRRARCVPGRWRRLEAFDPVGETEMRCLEEELRARHLGSEAPPARER
ncbi:MAG: hypothetical protein AAGH15_06055 [Myxococcota bacterium]